MRQRLFQPIEYLYLMCQIAELTVRRVRISILSLTAALHYT
jgi:hypothetical protein